MITFDLPPKPENTHLVLDDFNQFIESTANNHFGATLAGQAIASVLVSNGAKTEDLNAFSIALIAEHRGTPNVRTMLQAPTLGESFRKGFYRVMVARIQAEGATA